MPAVDNKRVAKNAVALTIRMVLVTIVGLYTSRIVLEALGVDDYGIYGVVGGVVGMGAFLNNSMAGATSRFITFEHGKGDIEKLKNIFSTALIIHFIIAIIVVILAETIGLWFLNYKMVIPENRMFAANVLYQFSVASVVVGFTQVPYAADIIAHEKMTIYAYFEIVNVLLKLGIVYLLLIIPNNRLIIYAGLTFAVSVLSAIFYRWYCIRHFQEAHLSIKFDKKTAKEMFSFSGYDLYGNMCVVAQTQGEPIILNLFFGVVANAAASITQTVTGVIRALVSNVMVAFRPQIIKQYALSDIPQMANLLQKSIQFTLITYIFIAVPVILETPYILFLWLGQVPEYTVAFIRIIIVAGFFHVVVQNNNIAVHATGNIKNISFINGTVYLMAPIISYILLRLAKTDINTVYVVNASLMSCSMLVGFIIIKRQIKDFPILHYCWSVGRCLIVSMLSFVSSFYILHKFLLGKLLLDNTWHIVLFCIISVIVNLLIATLLSYTIVLDSYGRKSINIWVKNRLHK